MCSLASEFISQKIHKNVINFLMPCLISAILLILISHIFLPNIGVQQTMYGLLQKYLWKHVNQLCLHSPSVIMWFKTGVFLGALAYEHPDSGCIQRVSNKWCMWKFAILINTCLIFSTV